VVNLTLGIFNLVAAAAIGWRPGRGGGAAAAGCPAWWRRLGEIRYRGWFWGLLLFVLPTLLGPARRAVRPVSTTRMNSDLALGGADTVMHLVTGHGSGL
jgi:hypothetical protein